MIYYTYTHTHAHTHIHTNTQTFIHVIDIICTSSSPYQSYTSRHSPEHETASLTNHAYVYMCVYVYVCTNHVCIASWIQHLY